MRINEDNKTMDIEEIWKVRAIVELEVPKDIVDDVEKLSGELTGEFVKVKGGQYENIAFGFITAIDNISSDTREWK